MARLTIELFRPQGGTATYRVSLQSDEDATPREHERDHRRAVLSLFPQLDLEEVNSPRFSVERESAPDPMLPCSCDGGGYEVIDLG
jgi:hypothetical protein